MFKSVKNSAIEQLRYQLQALGNENCHALLTYDTNMLLYQMGNALVEMADEVELIRKSQEKNE